MNAFPILIFFKKAYIWPTIIQKGGRVMMIRKIVLQQEAVFVTLLFIKTNLSGSFFRSCFTNKKKRQEWNDHSIPRSKNLRTEPSRRKEVRESSPNRCYQPSHFPTLSFFFISVDNGLALIYVLPSRDNADCRELFPYIEGGKHTAVVFICLRSCTSHAQYVVILRWPNFVVTIIIFNIISIPVKIIHRR